MAKLFIIIAAISAAVSVIMGAFGAHALKSRLDEKALNALHTGVEYQFYHALGLLMIGLLLLNTQAPAGVKTVGWLFIAGTILFSGSLYLLTLTGQKSFGIITPFGGMAFILGWLWLAFSYLKA